MFHLTQNREFQIKTTLRYYCFYLSDWQNKKVKTTFLKSLSHVHGILQARILEWVAFLFSRGSSRPRDQIQVSHIVVRVRDSLPAEPQGKPKNTGVGSLSLLQWIFLSQESNQCLLHCRPILYQLSYQGIPLIKTSLRYCCYVSHWQN